MRKRQNAGVGSELHPPNSIRQYSNFRCGFVLQPIPLGGFAVVSRWRGHRTTQRAKHIPRACCAMQMLAHSLPAPTLACRARRFHVSRIAVCEPRMQRHKLICKASKGQTQMASASASSRGLQTKDRAYAEWFALPIQPGKYRVTVRSEVRLLFNE